MQPEGAGAEEGGLMGVEALPPSPAAAVAWGLDLTVYTAEPGSAFEDALTLLASWAATSEGTDLSAGDRARAV
jgi:hypothetical protein